MKKLRLIYKLLTGLEQELLGAAQQYNRVNHRLFAEACHLLIYPRFISQETIIASYKASSPVIPQFTIQLTVNSLEVTSCLIVDPLLTAVVPAIIESWPPLVLTLNVTQDLDEYQQLNSLYQRVKYHICLHHFTRETDRLVILSLSQFQIFTLLLRNALFTA
ncbi:hypothetical protein AHMF7605_29230 [Adhaeribacter arboris]|uniref:Uncharacterized protein n=1 Tax=Adhaeribacter arboris TaxID=2072846 RepID=A0A2T2Y8L4_9BACT|nr:hypothetical protein [Adhaeribacter arboris]PSR51854.1 hypothetical protein AHMF7605_28485 [Adhaeribacter arboris]PSR51990.1 hypothetical protein AHMF7605_29230 [Adhaeribacter arboris]